MTIVEMEKKTPMGEVPSRESKELVIKVPKKVVAEDAAKGMNKGEVLKGYFGFERTNEKGETSWVDRNSLWGVWDGEKIISFINKDGAENFSKKIAMRTHEPTHVLR